MAQARRRFTDDFKREAVALLVSSGRPLTQIAGELGIAPSMLSNIGLPTPGHCSASRKALRNSTNS
jgi:transposase